MPASLIALAFALLATPMKADDAKTLAVQLTDEGAKTFDRKEAVAMAAFYADDAQVRVVSKDKDTGAIKVETKAGRAEVQEFYDTVFKSVPNPHAKNTVEHARRIGDDFLLITGTFLPEVDGNLKVPFVQTRVKKGDKWLIASLEIFILHED